MQPCSCALLVAPTQKAEEGRKGRNDVCVSGFSDEESEVDAGQGRTDTCWVRAGLAFMGLCPLDNRSI